MLTDLRQRLGDAMPLKLRRTMERYGDAVRVMRGISDPRVARSLAPSAIRGLILNRGKQGTPTLMQARHKAHFDWTYPSDNPEMADLYKRAKEGQWDGDRDLDWSTDVDPEHPDRRLLPADFVDWKFGRDVLGMKLDASERQRFEESMAAWTLSQFLHGEQGALYAAAQVTEAVQFFDGTLYGATQVVDEARHVEVFHRYLDEKLGRVYAINDNLFVIIDALMEDSRWDMKFLGMQIMVEGLALGAFSSIYQQTSEPLLKELLKRVIQDEARHVHYGVVALRDHIKNNLSERERREREDWAFEVALLMRNRFLAHELYDEWWSHKMTRRQWESFIIKSPGLERFRHSMFSRMVPNLREIGLLSDRIKPHYEKVGLMKYFGGHAADTVSESELLGHGPTPAQVPGARAVA